MVRCAVAGCRSRFPGRAKDLEGDRAPVSFFRFPLDEELRGEWIYRCKRNEDINPKGARICSLHFRREDYDPTYLSMHSLGFKSRPTLLKGVIPSQCLPATFSRRCKKETPRDVRRKKLEQRELVKQLLDKHYKETAAAPAEPAPATPPVDVIKPSVQIPRLAGSTAADGVSRRDSAGAGQGSAQPQTAADCFGDDTFIDNTDTVSDGENHGAEVAALPVIFVTTDQRKVYLKTPAAPGDGAVGGRPERSLADLPADTVPQCVTVEPVPSKVSDLILERTKEIWRMKLNLRKLEDKCRRVLAVPGAPRPGVIGGARPAAGGNGAQATASGEKAEGGRCPAEQPLMVLREERGAKLPTILTQVRRHQLSDEEATFTPSSLQEAQEANYQLKVQFLSLQSAVLKWAIKNKQSRDLRTKESEMKKQSDLKEMKVVRGARLRQLLRLEAAVKEIFSETQIRVMTRGHADEKQKFVPYWSKEDVRQVLDLRAISSDEVVAHVCEKMKIPLPNMSATVQRCKRSSELNEAYKAMLVKSGENQRRCATCKRQMDTIDEVVEAVAAIPGGGQSPSPSPPPPPPPPVGRRFVQTMQFPDDGQAKARPKKRRRTPALSRKKARRAAPAARWSDTSDSDAEPSDTGIWARLGAELAAGWQAGTPVLDIQPPDGRAQHTFSPYKRAWR